MAKPWVGSGMSWPWQLCFGIWRVLSTRWKHVKKMFIMGRSGMFYSKRYAHSAWPAKWQRFIVLLCACFDLFSCWRDGVQWDWLTVLGLATLLRWVEFAMLFYVFRECALFFDVFWELRGSFWRVVGTLWGLNASKCLWMVKMGAQSGPREHFKAKT